MPDDALAVILDALEALLADRDDPQADELRARIARVRTAEAADAELWHRTYHD